MLHHPEVEEGRRVPRDEDAVRMLTRGAKPNAPFADRQALAVAGSKGGKVARCAGDVAITAQNRIEEQCLAEVHERLAHARRWGERDDVACGRQLADERGNRWIGWWCPSAKVTRGVVRGAQGTHGAIVGAA